MAKTTTKYSKEIQARTIALVMEEGISPSRVAVRTKIPKRVIDSWVKGLVPEPALPMKPLDEMDEHEEDQHFIQTTFKAKLAAINRMLILIKKEQNLSRVSDALKVLHGITDKDDEGQSGAATAFSMYVDKAVMNIYPEINQKIEQLKKKKHDSN